ncbi:hypothetical protein BB561_000470 [Smittium simulii]|uniref:HTH La-type RNA-binding domain-containing protein n=1 Tax=Smittium simulii TaxID=133385 RepID=A0A2T9YYW5_9FUNG|nr:hypothetical protein BB561_000470 [Smittium simulii]
MDSINSGLKQLEYYLSDYNIRKDTYIRAAIEESKNGWLEASFFMQFPRFSGLVSEDDLDKILKEVTKADLAKRKIRRKRPYRPVDKEIVDARTVYMQGLYKPFNTAESIQHLFGDIFEELIFVNPYYDLKTNYFYGFAFLEFSSEKAACDFLEFFENLYSNSHIVTNTSVELCENETIQISENQEKNKLLEIKNKLPGLRLWPKIEWERLKTEYIMYKDIMQREYLRPPGINDSTIVKVHGINEESSIKNVLIFFSSDNQLLYIDYTVGSLSAHLIFEKSEDAFELNRLYNEKKIYYKSPSDNSKINSEQALDDPTNNVGENRIFIRAKVIKGKEETNYWEHIWQNPTSLYHNSIFSTLE